jgi:hypothetical protein
LATPQYRLRVIARAQLENEFPSLRVSRWEILSPATPDYNCHAWGVCESRIRWEPTPDDYWPPGLRSGDITDYTLDNFIRAYTWVGFRECPNGDHEFGFQKIAIYSEQNYGEEWPQHTARQTFWGYGWLSKMGYAEDIKHASPHDLEGHSYGRVVCYMRRSWFRALFDPSSTWISATMRHWVYRRRHPNGV